MNTALVDIEPGTVMGIGSLPLRDPREAVQWIADHAPDLPYWPQLPQRSGAEEMIAQAVCPLRGLLERHPRRPWQQVFTCGQMDSVLGALAECEPGMDGEHAAGLHALLGAAAQGAFPRARAIKGHVVGPVTLAMSLLTGASPQQHLARHPLLLRAVAAYTARSAQWQVRQLQQAGRPVVLVIDEPAVAMLDAAAMGISRSGACAAIRLVLGAIRGEGAAAGLHCCGRFDPAMLQSLGPDLMAFDATGKLDWLLPGGHVARYIANGGKLVFGLVPTAGGALPARSIFMKWLTAGIFLDDPQHLAQSTLVSTACGMGLRSWSATQRAMALCSEVGRLVGEAAAVRMA